MNSILRDAGNLRHASRRQTHQTKFNSLLRSANWHYIFITVSKTKAHTRTEEHLNNPELPGKA